jgi:hypothetical protein
MCHTVEGGFRKVPKKGHVLLEWPLKYIYLNKLRSKTSVGKRWFINFFKLYSRATIKTAQNLDMELANVLSMRSWQAPLTVFHQDPLALVRSML